VTHVVVLDFETASSCNLKVAGAWRYAEDPTTQVIVAGFTVDGKNPQQWVPQYNGYAYNRELFNLTEDPETIFVAHNAGFEKAIWRKIMVPVFGFPDIPNSRWRDTMAVCGYLALPLGLDGVTAALGLDAKKDKEGSKVTVALSKTNKKSGNYNHAPEILQRVYNYNLSDLVAENELLNAVGYLPHAEQQVWLLDQRINERGVHLDLPLIDGMLKIAQDASVPLLAEFHKITEGACKTAKTGGISPVKLTAWCRANGADIPNLTQETMELYFGTEDAEIDPTADVTSWFGTMPDLPDKVYSALQIRNDLARASIKKLARMQQCVGEDGRVRGLLQYHGAHSGRWTGRLFQPQNFPRASLKDVDPEIVAMDLTQGLVWLAENYGKPLDVLSKSMRYTITPSPSRRLVAGDFSSIELRILLAVAGQWDKVDLIEQGASPYIDMAQLIYGRPISKESDPAEYTVGKTGVLGLGYQMGGPKFQSMFLPSEPLAFCKRIVDTYRKEWAPNVPPVWRGYEDAALRAVKSKKTEAYGVTFEKENGFLSARLPSGRKLWYRNPKLCRKVMPWSEPGKPDVREAWTFEGTKLGQWKTIDAFGGLLTGHIIQALARDMMVAAMFKCEINGFPIVLTVHDEIVSEPLRQDADVLAFKQIMCDSPAWARDLRVPISAACWIGNRYHKE